jgi:hypothetical protein
MFAKDKSTTAGRPSRNCGKFLVKPGVTPDILPKVDEIHQLGTNF